MGTSGKSQSYKLNRRVRKNRGKKSQKETMSSSSISLPRNYKVISRGKFDYRKTLPFFLYGQITAKIFMCTRCENVTVLGLYLCVLIILQVRSYFKGRSNFG